jgi:octaprenyl-diphosphate synthase
MMGITVPELISDDLKQFDRKLESELSSDIAVLGDIGLELIRAGGKRLRPSLSFLTARLLSASREDGMRVALAVELLHTASLLHDDLIDDAETRRGHTAAFRQYGNALSVMAGDFMLARVLRLLAVTNEPELTLLLADTAAAICEGEVLQFQLAAAGTRSFESYRRVIDSKTGVLIAAALEGVAILAGVDDARRSALRKYGLHFGRAFQLQDDYLDLLGDPASLGKPTGGDLREGKATYPVLLLLDQGVSEAAAILERRAAEAGDVERMASLVRQHGADEATRAEVMREADTAIQALAAFPESAARNELMKLGIRERDRIV